MSGWRSRKSRNALMPCLRSELPVSFSSLLVHSRRELAYVRRKIGTVSGKYGKHVSTFTR